MIFWSLQFGPDGRCFLVAWSVSTSVIALKHDRPEPILPKRKGIHPFRCPARVANRQTSFSVRGNAWIKLPFSGHVIKKFQKPTILQLNIEGLIASKVNVLHYLALQSEAPIILLQETHCTDPEKLVLPSYQLATKIQSKRLKYMLLNQSPLTSEIEWLCVDG